MKITKLLLPPLPILFAVVFFAVLSIITAVTGQVIHTLMQCFLLSIMFGYAIFVIKKHIIAHNYLPLIIDVISLLIIAMTLPFVIHYNATAVNSSIVGFIIFQFIGIFAIKIIRKLY